MSDSLKRLDEEVTACRRCPRLVAHREEVARVKRRAYRDAAYWGRPVPGFGDARARLVLVGLAPGAHGSNRTGRPFTGDASGDFLFPALHRAGFASQPLATGRGDGLRLVDTYLTAAVRCAPPCNRPAPGEFAACAPFLERELRLLRAARVYVALGALAFRSLAAGLKVIGKRVDAPRPRFAHGARFPLAGGAGWLCGVYHPSRQNTQTGRLTAPMYDAALSEIRDRLI